MMIYEPNLSGDQVAAASAAFLCRQRLKALISMEANTSHAQIEIEKEAEKEKGRKALKSWASCAFVAH